MDASRRTIVLVEDIDFSGMDAVDSIKE